MFFSRTIYRQPAETHETYWEDTWASTGWDRLVATQPKKDWWPQLEALVAKVPPGDLVLEAGCGAGPVVYLLQQKGVRVRGVDTAAEAITRSRAAHPELDLVVGDVEHLDLPDASVALYVSLGVVEHDPDGPDDILREAARVTRPGGAMFLTVPYHNVYRRLREPWWRFAHLVRRAVGKPLVFYQYAFTRRAVERMLARAGFEVLEVRYCHTRVAVKKDLPRLSGPDHKFAAAADRLSPRLLAHVIAVSARRVEKA